MIDIDLPQVVRVDHVPGDPDAIGAAAELLSSAKLPAILNGAGVVLSGDIPASVTTVERLLAPVCRDYQHNDTVPRKHLTWCGPLVDNGSKSGLEMISRADVILPLGTRLNPFSRLPANQTEDWPSDAKTSRSVSMGIRLTRRVARGNQGGARKVAEQCLARRSEDAGDPGRADREAASPSRNPAGRNNCHP